MAGPFKYELLVTADGSHTLYVPELKENYHSGFGAHTESQHIFIQGGLLKAFSEFRGTLRILEAGFGTGLNALLSLDAAARYQRKLHYTGIEAYPLPGELISQLNYTTDRYQEHYDAFIAMHRAPQGQETLITPGFRLIRHSSRLETFTPDDTFHLCYFDAFAPDIQPELWTQQIFSKIFHALIPGGLLLTYSCKGEVRRNMKACGFQVEKLPGPPGKREYLRAQKPL
jgi:tRNA U34 5-methylaminomethyl-2-thiouridine-forming methyltransferase MnmC